MYARLALACLLLLFLAFFRGRAEAFQYDFPEEIELDGGAIAKRVEVVGGRPDEVSYAVESSEPDGSGLPARAAYQALDPNGFREGGITAESWMETEHYKIPLSYTRNVDTSVQEDRVIYDRIKDISPEDRAKFLACQGHWTGKKCVFEDDVCEQSESEDVTPNSLDQVRRWRSGACEPLPECRTGFWDGSGCTLAGDDCEGDEPNQEHAWARDADGFFACEPLPSCISSWYSESSGTCIAEGEHCEVASQKGAVVARGEGGYMCELEMETRDGFRLLTNKVATSSEEECYLACLRRPDGCFSYSFDGSECSTGGESTNFASRDKDSVLKFTPSARLYPFFSAEISASGADAVVEWEPFNSRDFRMFVARSPDMSNKEEVAASGDPVSVDPGDDLFFQPEYDMGTGAPPLPHRVHVALPDGPPVFDASKVVFEVENRGEQSLAVKWRAPIEDDMLTEVEFPGTERRRVHPYGSTVIKFDTIGPRVFSLFVTRSNGEEVYSTTVTAEVSCEAPKSVVLADGTCAHYSGEWSVGQPSGTLVPISWSFEFGEGVFANLEVGDVVFERIEPTGSVIEDVRDPGETTVRLIVFYSEGADTMIVDEDSRQVVLSCDPPKTEWKGRCVDECPEPPSNGRWVIGDPCELVCDQGFREWGKSCVPARGSTCSQTILGKFVADGEGGCDLDCDSNTYKLNGECFKICTGSTPPRAYWTNDPQTHECRLACTDPSFEIGLDGCFQTCPPPPNANSRYGHDPQTGLCRIECELGFDVFDGTCVPEKDSECPWDTEVVNGAAKSDGQGGCTVDCSQGFEEDPADPNSCRRICEGTPAVGAFFDEYCNEVCENPDETFHNGSCVLAAGTDCGDAPTGGSSTANGDGTCTKTCDEQGKVVADGECIIPELACDDSKFEFEFQGACYSVGEVLDGVIIENGRAIMNSAGYYDIDCDEGFKYTPACGYNKCVHNDTSCILPG